MTPSPFAHNESPASNGTGGEPLANAAATDAKKAPSESAKAKVESVPKEARPGDNSTTAKGAVARPPAQDSPPLEHADGAVTEAAGSKDGPKAEQAREPLPDAEEFERQNVRDAAVKEAELAEQERARAERARAVMQEERIKFRDELRQILATHGKQSGPEIDELVRQSGKLHDAKTFTRARNIWRQLRLSQPVKVAQIRALEIPEPAILNFISDNLYARMRTPGGPRDDNEVRVRAAQLLLSYKLQGEAESPELLPNRSQVLKARGTNGPGPK
jgi:hypothetical protein